MQAYFHVGLVHCMAYPEVMKPDAPPSLLLETLEEIARDDFFQAVEVSRIDDPARRKEAASLLATSGLEAIFAAQPVLISQKLSLCSLDAAARGRAVQEVIRCIEQAYELGAAILALYSGPDPGPEKREEARAMLIDSLEQLCGRAQERGVDYMLAISLENFDRSVDKKALIGPTREAAEVASAVKARYSNFGLTVDLSHQPLLGESAHEMVIAASDDLIHAHIGNCVTGDRAHPAFGDQHPRFGLAGGQIGAQEVKRFLEALTYSGYFRKTTPTRKPVVSFEVKPLPGESPQLVIANAKRTLREAWAAL
jgi:sugar phosphate isomerase/epimerase